MRQITLAVIGTLLAAIPAHAWEKHQSLMASILAGIPAGSAIDRPLPAPCPEDDQRIFTRLAAELLLNPKALVVPTAFEACTLKRMITGREILLGGAVDEPDHGMDQDLPYPREAIDPLDSAKWMGGTTGRTSTGFRHMYFGSWQGWHPIKTFQIPLHAIGYAPDRAAITARKARELIAQGGIEAAWGYRVLAWSIHYLTDLTQPFHAVQLPDLRMVPWYALAQWPPKEAFGDLVRETTRTIANYHWAFEQYTLHRLTTLPGAGIGRERVAAYQECIREPDSQAPLALDPRKDELQPTTLVEPKFLAERVARASVEIADSFGSAVYAFFTARLRDREVDIPDGKGVPDYAQMTLAPDLIPQREELARQTCRALADASIAARTVIGWAAR